MLASLFNDRLKFFPSFYYLKNIPNIPDGAHSFLLDYSIIHTGAKYELSKKKKLTLNADFYHNVETYENEPQISFGFKDQKTAYTIGIEYGHLDSSKDWKATLTYAYIERFAILDYMAQNDWARWDYSNYDSPDGRLSNYQGVELVIAYALTKKINLVSKYYFVEQLIPLGAYQENGQRIRFDLNISL